METQALENLARQMALSNLPKVRESNLDLSDPLREKLEARTVQLVMQTVNSH